VIALLLAGCNPAPSQADLDSTRGNSVEVMFNEPGTRDENAWWDPDAVNVMIEMIDSAKTRIDFAVMGFSYEPVVDALIEAYDRGVSIRMVGDAGHLYNDGYSRFDERGIPMVVGNLNHIMHDKFMIVDDRFLFCGTSNWTPTDLIRNSNNFVKIDSTAVAADFSAEFEQMYGGVFGHNKVEIDNERVYEIGDTTVEVWFAPNEDAMGRILELVDAAQSSVRFTIFAFTKDQVGSAFIRKQQEFDALNLADGTAELPFTDRRSIAGVVDRSQLHSNGQYHEVYRLLAAGIPMRLDGNNTSMQPGDYQAGGGRLHSKTMLIDAEGEDPIVITGSFNWSSSATVSNDEFLLVLRGGRIAQEFADYFSSLWDNGFEMGETRVADGSIAPGDVIINEIMWYGAHSGDDEGYDEFIELRNTTGDDISLDMWQIAGVDDFVVGLPPGSTIPAYDTFLIVDHVLEAYEDGAPQDENSAYLSGDMVVNAFNDNRQSRLYLKDGTMELFLQDPDAAVIDIAGDGGPPFAGGPDGDVVRSMERRQEAGDGTTAAAWYEYSGSAGIGVVNPDYAAEILASPDERNSAE
jgi:phosphatidylserine/phosphatidylglycerophosphate/cardiolipin synthase-like enzyme